MNLHGRNVVITGASQGIGEKMADAFAAKGANLLLVARSGEKLATISNRVGGSFMAADLTDEFALDSLVADCLGRLQHIDVWVNNAGVETEDAFVHIPRDDIRTLARLNFEAPLMLTRDVLPHMLKRGEGHIVQMSSLAGAMVFPGLTAYAGSKAGLTNFTESLRLELRHSNVGLTLVAPGPVDTEMWDRIQAPSAWPAPALNRFRHLRFLPKVNPAKLASDVVAAVEANKRYVRPKHRFLMYHTLNNAPRRLVEASMTGVKMQPLKPTDQSVSR